MASACYNDEMAISETTTGYEQVKFVLCDLDGVVWLRRTAIPGAPEAIERLRQSGRRVLFVTNNSMSTIAEQERALAAVGVPAEGDVVTSAQAAAALVAPAGPGRGVWWGRSRRGGRATWRNGAQRR